MATTLSKIQSQIEKLQAQAEQLKSAVIHRLRKEINQHGLTADDLFGGAASPNARKGTRGTATAKTPPASREAKYGDSAGNTWGGVGKRPQWLRDALEGGASIDDFLLVADSGKRKRRVSLKARASAPAKKQKVSKTRVQKVAGDERAPIKSSREMAQPTKRIASKRAAAVPSIARGGSSGSGSEGAPS